MKRQAPQINAGSMADIAFLLLIFWLVATTIKPDRGLPGFLENADDKVKIAVPTKSSDLLRVHVTEEGVYEVDGDAYTLDALGNEILTLLQTKGFKSKLVITAEYEAPYKEYMELLLLAKELQIKIIENEIKKEKETGDGD